MSVGGFREFGGVWGGLGSLGGRSGPLGLGLRRFGGLRGSRGLSLNPETINPGVVRFRDFRGNNLILRGRA